MHGWLLVVVGFGWIGVEWRGKGQRQILFAIVTSAISHHLRSRYRTLSYYSYTLSYYLPTQYHTQRIALLSIAYCILILHSLAVVEQLDRCCHRRRLIIKIHSPISPRYLFILSRRRKISISSSSNSSRVSVLSCSRPPWFRISFQEQSCPFGAGCSSLVRQPMLSRRRWYKKE